LAAMLFLIRGKMAKKFNGTLDTRVLDNLSKHLDGNVSEAVASAAFMVQGRAKVKAPVDTGALEGSIGVSMKRGGNANAAAAVARARRPDAVISALPVPKDDHTAFVGPSVEYGMEVELGSSKRAGRPYLGPALRETEADLKKFLSKAVQDK
jgi:hypothetical protein